MIKSIALTLLSLILVVSSVNLATSLRKSGAAAQKSEYQVLNSAQMDNIGFRAIADEEGLKVSDKGEITFPKEIADKIVKVNMLPHTIELVEKDGGWQFVAVTNDDHYIFRRPFTGKKRELTHIAMPETQAPAADAPAAEKAAPAVPAESSPAPKN